VIVLVVLLFLQAVDLPFTVVVVPQEQPLLPQQEVHQHLSSVAIVWGWSMMPLHDAKRNYVG